MKNPQESVKSWTQSTLVSPPVLKIVCSFGVMVEADHVQAQVEVWDETGSNLLALTASPHRAMCDAPDLLDAIVGTFVAAVRDVIEPF
jgi:hypothetical protein